MYTTHKGRIIVDCLKEDGNIEISHKNARQTEEHGHCSRPDYLVLEHCEWNHGIIALATLPQDKEDKGDARRNKKANNNRAVPWMLVAAKLQSQKKHDNRWANKHKSSEIERFDGAAENLQWRALDLGFRDPVEEDETADDDA